MPKYEVGQFSIKEYVTSAIPVLNRGKWIIKSNNLFISSQIPSMRMEETERSLETVC
jgi:hypothetical protein